MFRLEKSRALIASGLVIIFALTVIPICTVSSQTDPFSEIKQKLYGISDEEKEILQNLFTLAQEVELLEAEEKELSQEAEAINLEIKELETEIAGGENDYEKKQEGLKSVLRSYQRMGPGSFFEIILDSDSLSTFLHRVNTVRDLVRNTGELLEQLESKAEKLSKMKTLLSEKLMLVKHKQEQSKDALTKKMELKLEKEEYLSSLMGKREYYQEYLTNIEGVWNELKPLVSEAVNEFSHIIEEGNLPTDALKITYSFLNIKGSIDDKSINKVISEQSSLPGMVFAFHPGKVEVSLPEKNIVLSGTFAILEGHILKFQAQEGSFFGMSLEQGSIEELFSNGDLVLNLEPLLAGNLIHALEIKEGYLELISKLKLF